MWNLRNNTDDHGGGEKKKRQTRLALIQNRLRVLGEKMDEGMG